MKVFDLKPISRSTQSEYILQFMNGVLVRTTTTQFLIVVAAAAVVDDDDAVDDTVASLGVSLIRQSMHVFAFLQSA